LKFIESELIDFLSLAGKCLKGSSQGFAQADGFFERVGASMVLSLKAKNSLA
jgi:hypothetical protein